MVVGLTFTAAYIIGIKFRGMAPWCMGISAEGIGAVGMFLNLGTTIVVSYLTPPPLQHIQDLVQNIRVPSHVGKAIVFYEGHE
jgi:cation/acetate symporter